jgi:hypothetical protein
MFFFRNQILFPRPFERPPEMFSGHRCHRRNGTEAEAERAWWDASGSAIMVILGPPRKGAAKRKFFVGWFISPRPLDRRSLAGVE